jgi:hypothetical protein
MNRVVSARVETVEPSRWGSWRLVSAFPRVNLCKGTIWQVGQVEVQGFAGAPDQLNQPGRNDASGLDYLDAALHHWSSQGTPSRSPSILTPGQRLRKYIASAHEVICVQ